MPHAQTAAGFDAPAVEAHGLHKRFDELSAVAGIDLTIPRGGFVGLLGPNGAGKTTMIRMMTGQSEPTEGSLSVLGWRIPAQSAYIRRHIGLVPQENNLDPDLTVRQNLEIYSRYFRIPKAMARRRIDELLSFVALTDRSKSKIDTLSGGMKRRLLIARALLSAPMMIVLDEPTTGLDPQARHMIWEKVRRLNDSGITVILTTHYMEEAERLCDDVILIDHGKVLDRGTPAALIARHVGREVFEIHDWEPDVPPPDRLPPDVARAERHGSTLHLYAEKPMDVEAYRRVAADRAFLHRPANLEDVFLRLCGRDLRE